jgi:hypothetical protein
MHNGESACLYVGCYTEYQSILYVLTGCRFSTGITGYIGGDFLSVITRERLHWNVSALIRDAEKASFVQKAYPNVRVVEGDPDSSGVIEREVERADIIYRKLKSREPPTLASCC